MRLLNIDSLEVEEFIGSSLPPYTILSHTWGVEEVTLQDLPKVGLTRLVGFRKLQYLCDQTRQDGFQYTWVDTCCIDRRSSAELSEAINSMYQWYSKAKVCYVYLCDVHYTEGEDIDPTSAFYHSRWFARSWTLQELIAPNSVTFYDAYWRCIGTKESLLDIISAITGIPQLCLGGKKAPADFSVATRFSWASKRRCTRPEDIAYSLMGLFGVCMPLLYGEGEKAFFRLQGEIFKSIDDQSILSWAVSNEDSRCGKPSSVFARSPADFATVANIYPLTELQTPPPCFTSRGLSISLPLDTAPKGSISSLLKDSEPDDLSRIQVAYLNCGPDMQHAVQILLVSSLPSAVTQSPPTTFYRLAAPLSVVKQCHHLKYRNIYIKIGLENLFRSREAVPRDNTTELVSSSFDEGSVPPRPSQDLSFTDSSITKVGLENLLRSRDTVPYPNMTESVSSSSGKGSVPPSPSRDLSVTDSSVTKIRFAPEETVLAAVVDNLTEEMVCNVTGKLFLPEGTLNRILDDDVMLQSLWELPQTPGRTAEKIKHLFPMCRRIFAILALSGLLRFFQILVDRLGVSDECLPMPDPEFLSTPTLLIGAGNPEHLEKWKSAAGVFEKKLYTRIFFERQWCVLAPVFRSSNHIQHYSFSQHHILPFVRKMSSPSANGMKHTEKYDFKYGSFGDIQKVRIHPDHYEFETESNARFLGRDSTDKPSNLFAVKTLRGTNRDGFEKEKQALERFRKLGSLTILQLLASYEIQADDTDHTPITYNMLFPWADGNLKELWESDQYLRDESIVPWIAEQCWKLADVLMIIHNGYLNFDPKADRFYGIHGDIKPANILRFSADSTGDSERLGRLVVGDFGLTNFHRESSRSMTNTSHAGYSIPYSAPEFRYGGKISRKVDIWALGCVFLEFIIWFLMGSTSVLCKFPDLRADMDTSTIQTDAFFEHAPYDDKGASLARLKPVVLEWIHTLYSNDGCSDYLSDFLDLIRSRMLVVNAQDRIQANELSQQLEKMYRKCLSKPQYYHANSNRRKSATQRGGTLINSRGISNGGGAKREWFFSLLKSWLCL
ncbi:hypothetical protein GGS24DRAFT_461623 [Hypoxylon argillaceum]|nr:hypothetical protein GGS24DRAFT_461623 [Hypoxylon argillaceum]